MDTVRIWTGVLQEEADRHTELLHKKKVDETTTTKARSPASTSAPCTGSQVEEEPEDKPDKRWISPKRESERERSSKRSLEEVRERFQAALSRRSGEITKLQEGAGVGGARAGIASESVIAHQGQGGEESILHQTKHPKKTKLSSQSPR